MASPAHALGGEEAAADPEAEGAGGAPDADGTEVSRGGGAAGPAPDPEDEAGAGGVLARLTAFRERHETAEIALFFAGGFLYDVVTVDRIDDAFTLLQQGLFLTLLAVLVGLDLRLDVRGVAPGGLLGKAWDQRESAIHFLFGSLLSAYTVFYFRSASGLAPVVFLAALFGLLVANELPRFRRLGPVVRIALLAFTLVSFFAYLLPVVVGTLSGWLFAAAALLAGGLLYGLTRLVTRWSGDPALARRRVAFPGAAVVAALVVLYYVGAVPPVPVSLRQLGIYHRVERDAAGFHLWSEPAGPRLWPFGRPPLRVRPGDRVYAFVRVFAPTEFRDTLKVRWAVENAKGGWTVSDAIPLSITGGRTAGYRGYAYKRHWRPGHWRVEVETDDGRLLGRIPFDIVEDDTTEPRVFRIEDG